MTDASHSQLLPDNRNRRLGYILAVVAVLMIGAAYAAVPLYTLFCQVTGFAGTTMRADANPKGVIAREMTVRFDATVNGGLPWTVHAAAPVTDNVGTTETVVYRATNHSDKPVTATAAFNVAPEQAGSYFNKIECFCFTEQTLQPGESVDMPVVFFVDPDIEENADLRTLQSITLSYTFYASDSEGS